MPAAHILHGDDGYDSNAIRRQVKETGTMPNMPLKTNRGWKNCYSPVLYRDRNAIGRMFCRSDASPRDTTEKPSTSSLPSASRALYATGCEAGPWPSCDRNRIPALAELKGQQIAQNPTDIGATLIIKQAKRGVTSPK